MFVKGSTMVWKRIDVYSMWEYNWWVIGGKKHRDY